MSTIMQWKTARDSRTFAWRGTDRVLCGDESSEIHGAIAHTVSDNPWKKWNVVIKVAHNCREKTCKEEEIPHTHSDLYEHRKIDVLATRLIKDDTK
jgi:hypothetical protein